MRILCVPFVDWPVALLAFHLVENCLILPLRKHSSIGIVNFSSTSSILLLHFGVCVQATAGTAVWGGSHFRFNCHQYPPILQAGHYPMMMPVTSESGTGKASYAFKLMANPLVPVSMAPIKTMHQLKKITGSNHSVLNKYDCSILKKAKYILYFDINKQSIWYTNRDLSKQAKLAQHHTQIMYGHSQTPYTQSILLLVAPIHVDVLAISVLCRWMDPCSVRMFSSVVALA